MVRTVGSILAIYSRFGGEYANSIRWVRQGGYLEMYNTLVNSREFLSNKAKFMLVITILSSIAASIVDVGAVYFIRPSVKWTNPSSQLIATTQFTPYDLQKSFGGWNAFVRNGANITDAITSMINATNRIPNAVEGRVYTPQISKYQVGCDKLNFYAMNFTPTENNFFYDQGGCATVNYGINNAFTETPNKTTIVDRPNGQRSIKMPGSYGLPYLAESLTTVDLTYGDTTCSLVQLEVGGNIPTGTDGLTSPPKTFTTRCVLPTGEIVALSQTAIKFSIFKAQNFHRVTSKMFKVDVELISAMEASVKAASNKTYLLAELRFGDTSLETLVCITTNLGNPSSSVVCLYASINTFITTQQDFNPRIAAALGTTSPGGSSNLLGSPLGNDLSIVMLIYHIPTLTNNSIQQLSIPEAKNASYMSALYLTSLGHNLYMDWNTSMLYVIYNTVGTQAGLEIPLWLSIIVLITMLLCAVFCWSTQFFLDPMYTGSLYKVMSIQMAPKSNSFAEMIRWSKSYSMDSKVFHNSLSDNGFYDVDIKSDVSLMRI
ncbi:hypothetical protein BGZ46_001064 [Entomortierella lignicola]|nr:hypothetical protein BGZ46_001064 [Entomortierella lignicola]